MPLSQFEDLVVWQRAREVSIAIYRASASGSFSRDFALRDQMRRAAVSVMSNIAEGFERYSRTEFRHFLSIARGSALELRSQLHLAHELGYFDHGQFTALHQQCLAISRMLARLRAVSTSRKP